MAEVTAGLRLPTLVDATLRAFVAGVRERFGTRVVAIRRADDPMRAARVLVDASLLHDAESRLSVPNEYSRRAPAACRWPLSTGQSQSRAAVRHR